MYSNETNKAQIPLRRLCDKVRDLSQTLLQTSRHVEMLCVYDFRDLCQRLSPKLHGFMICHRLCSRLSPRGSFGESRRNGIWATASLTKLNIKYVISLIADKLIT